MLCLRIFFVLFIEKHIYHCTLPLNIVKNVRMYAILIKVLKPLDRTSRINIYMKVSLDPGSFRMAKRSRSFI